MSVLGTARFMATNLITSHSVLVPSSQATGVASKAQKAGSGSGTMAVSGTYSNAQNLDYVIEIETTGEIGTATFKWSDDGGATWDATGVATSTSPVSLNNGLSVAWTQGDGNDVVDGDIWRFKGFLPYHRMYLLDRERDTEWRSASVGSAVTLDVDLGSAMAPQALALLDHNLTSAATIRIQGSSLSNYSVLSVNELIPWRTGALLYYLTNASPYRYWRLSITDTANPAGYLRASEWFLGLYADLRMTYELGDAQGKMRVGKREQMLSGKYYGQLNAVVRTFDLTWERVEVEDRTTLFAVFDALHDLVNRRVLGVFFNADANDLSQIALCEWHEGAIVANTDRDAPDQYTIHVRLIELPRTV